MKYLVLLIPLLLGCNKKFAGDGKITEDEIPQVGWEAVIKGEHHDAGGVAVVIDESTIEVQDFTYDGGGLNSRLFLVADGQKFFNDYELTDNLVGTEFNGDTLTVDIPKNSTGKWNVITLWCLPAKVSFGDGQFRAPK